MSGPQGVWRQLARPRAAGLQSEACREESDRKINTKPPGARGRGTGTGPRLDGQWMEARRQRQERWTQVHGHIELAVTALLRSLFAPLAWLLGRVSRFFRC